jgi:hypothetical protein
MVQAAGCSGKPFEILRARAARLMLTVVVMKLQNCFLLRRTWAVGLALVVMGLAGWWFSPKHGAPPPSQSITPSITADGGIGTSAKTAGEVPPPFQSAPVPSLPRLRAIAPETIPPGQEELWKRRAPEEPLASFQRWADRYAALPPEERAAAVAEGVRLAAVRREVMAELIEHDPARALERAVPESVRRQLPGDVAARLEERIDGRGHLKVIGAVPGADVPVPRSRSAITTRVEINGRSYAASVYGRREHQPTRWNIPLHGIALDERMAVSEWPARMLESIELREALARRRAEPVCSASQQPVLSANTTVGLRIATEIEFFCRPPHAADQLAEAAAREVLLPPGFGRELPQPIIAASGGNGITVPNLSAQGEADWTTGAKRIVIVRLSFNGLNYHNLAESNCVEIINRMSDTFSRWSYGKHSLKPVGQGSWISPVLNLPLDADDYDGDDIEGIWLVASAWIQSQGWGPNKYDYMMCVAGPAPIRDPDDSYETVWWSGLGQIGDKFTFLRTGGDFLADKLDLATTVGLHELGHNLGLRHTSSLWTTPQPIVTVGGTTYYQYSAEYGDRFDRMGHGRDDYNVRYKQWLHWLGDSEVPLGTTDGVYYLNDHDTAENGGLRGLQVPFTVPVGAELFVQDSLFVEYRTYPSNALLRAGPTIRLASPLAPKAFLLDGTPETPNHEPDDINGDPDLSGNLDSPLPPGRTLSLSKYGKTVHLTNLETDPESGKLKVMVVHGTPPGNSPPDGSLEFSVSPVAVGQKVFLIALAQDIDGDTVGYNWQVPGSDPLPNAFLVPVTFNSAGTKTIQCLLTDMRGGTRMLTRDLTVVQNSPPSISGLSNRSTDEDTAINVDFTVSDATTPANQITVTAVSEDQSLVQDSGLAVSSLGGGNRRLAITPRPNRHGEVTITVTANDGVFIHIEKFQLTIQPVTPGTVVVASGSTWRYWDRDREPPTASGSWKNPGYNDSTWPSDNARFVFNEFLVLPGWTVLANEPDRITCYFRKTFNVLIRPSGTPTLKLLCDDAAVVYLNGVEVWRQNLPGGAITHATRALNSVEGRDERAFNIIPLPDAPISLGSNTLAIEVHDRSSSLRGGGDVSFDAELAFLQTPSLVAFSDRTTPEDTTLSFSFTSPADSESPSGGIEMSARSSNQTIVLDADIKFGFNNLVIPPRRTIAITPRPNATGQTEITVIASDGSSETWQQFLLTVTPVNDAPTLQPIPDLTTALGEIPAAVPVTVEDIDSPLASLTVNATSSNQSLLPNGGITVLPGDTPARRWLRFTPNPGIAAQSTVRVVVSDGQLSTTNSFIFRVTLPLSPNNVPARLVQSGDLWRYWVQPLPTDSRGNPIDWTNPNVDDRAWPTGRSRLGYANANLDTTIPVTPLRVTTYFRRSFNLIDPSQITQLNFRLLRDDGAVVYLNGQQIRLSNMPRGAITASTLADSAVDGLAEEAWENFSLTSLTALRTGWNVIAVEVHQAAVPSTFQQGDLSFDLEIDGVVATPLASDALIAPGEPWRYWDEANYPDETWRQAHFDDSTWKRGLARLGFGIGGESTVIQGGPTNARNASVLLRKVFAVADPALYSALHLMVQRDDGVQVYLNGTRVLADHVASGAALGDFALDETPPAEHLTWRHFLLDPKKLLRGGNLLAVELHQASATGADLTFDAQLLGVVNGSPRLYLRPLATGYEVSWPAAFNGWTLEASPTMQPGSWQTVTQPPLLDGAWLYVQTPAGPPFQFFRLRK